MKLKSLENTLYRAVGDPRLQKGEKINFQPAAECTEKFMYYEYKHLQ